MTPHDLYDWDLQDPPVLTTAAGRPVVIDGGKAGILVELDARTGKLLWKRPLGVHDGHDNDGLLTEHATAASQVGLPAGFCLEPGPYGGIETQLASNGSTTFAAVNDLAIPVTSTRFGGSTLTGAVVLRTPLSAGSNAPVAIDGDYVIAGAGTPLSSSQRPMIIAYKLGAHGKLPETVGA